MKGDARPQPRPRPKGRPAKIRMPWETPAGVEPADIYALQALQKGSASAGQQQRALALVIERICEVDRMSFYPGGRDGERASDFAEGKRFVGGQIRRFLKMRPARSENSEPPSPPQTESGGA
jgi:hypothetical protein